MSYDPSHLRTSVFAVPPLARDASGAVCPVENGKLIRFIEAGGVRSLLYGGNAVFYHIKPSELAGVLSLLTETAGRQTVVVPSVGPAFGTAMDQVDVVREFDFPTTMLLPSRDAVDQAGIATGARRIAEALGRPIVLYIKFDNWLDAELVRALENDGVISWIKYAVVREDPSDDDYLRQILDVFPAERVVSGIGEQPAIIHMRDFGVAGFTSGCVCVAPQRSMEMLTAITAGKYEQAEEIRKWFLPLEDLRNEINPIRVLHHAVAEAEIANTGPLPPMLSDLSEVHLDRIRGAVRCLR